MRSVLIASAAFHEFPDDHEVGFSVSGAPRGLKPAAQGEKPAGRKQTIVARFAKQAACCLWAFSCWGAVAVAGQDVRGDDRIDAGRPAKVAPMPSASSASGLAEWGPPADDWIGDLPPADVGIVASQGILPAPGCALLGLAEFPTRFTRNLVFRANVFRIVEPAVISEFGFLLDIDPNILVDLYFSIHEKPFPFDPNAFFTANSDFPVDGVMIHVPVDPLRVGPELFTTGPLAIPVSLSVDTGYVFGVAWGLEFLTYERDPAQSAAPGTVLPDFPNAVFVGPASRTITIDQLPTPQSWLLLPSGTGGPWAMEICVTGACCLPNATCQDLTGTDCQAAGGIETMPGVTCAQLGGDSACPLATAACCTNESCAVENQFECEGDGGTWFQDIENCGDPVLCEPKGACCTLAGTCLNAQTQSACEGIGGNYRGDDSDCATVNPQCNRGACCLGPGNCDLRAPGVEVFECDPSRGEVFWGFGVSCDPNPCFVTGACCTDTTCTEMRSEDCQEDAGHYRGDDTRCATMAIPCGRGACCRGDVGCTDAAGVGIPELECANLNGTFRGDGTNCDTITPACPGICCEPGNVCSDNVNPVSCTDSLGGSFGGYTTCDDFIPGTDPPPCDAIGATGPCCLPIGSCVTTSVAVCTQLGGTVSASQDCAAATCVSAAPAGGCCLPDETCALLEAADCEASGGIFRGDGVGCPGVGESDCLRGSCCLIIGGCSPDVVQADCDATVGSFQVGVACVGALCADGGACCLPNETCETLASDRCVAANGVFQGAGVNCVDVTTCVRGACCDAGTCSETLQADCAGTYLGDTIACVPNACETGACCRDGQPCAITTVAVCVADGGVHAGAATTCAGAPCLQGACCHDDGTCDEDQFNFMCAAALDELSPGLACTQIDCQPRGACCLNGICADSISVLLCESLDGVAGQPGSQCSDFTNPCDAGVCCLDDGSCLDEVSQNVVMVKMACETLESPGGIFTPDETCFTLTCPQVAACCLPTGGCDLVLENQCVAMGGAFVGENEACGATTCADGACCGVDAVCVDNRGFECDLIEGLFSVGFACSDGVVCPDLGACCHLDTSCTTDTATDCFFFGGNYAGDGTTCSGTSCAAGSCCELDGICTDNTIESQCSAVDGFSPGSVCADVPCEPRGGCCIGGVCGIQTEIACLAGGGGYLGDGSDCAGDPCTLSIVSSVPSSNEIDARQPHDPNDITPVGWMSVELVFDGDAGALALGDFTITTTGGAVPTVVAVTASGNSATLDFDIPIPPAAWTQVTHTASGSSVCLGYLPADVDGDGTSTPVDILAVIDALNGVIPRPIYATDTDRSNVAGPEDILSVIDLLNGAAMFDLWLGQSLGTSPCP